MEYLDKENMADVDQKQEKIEDERKIMRRKKKKLGGIKTMPFIFGMFAKFLFYNCLFLLLFLSGIDNVFKELSAREISN